VVNRTGDNISRYQIGSTGGLTPLGEPVAAGKHPISIVIHPSGKYAYVTNQNGNSISQYTLSENGELMPMTPATVASLVTPVSIAIEASGKYAYVSNISSNNVSLFAIDENGGFIANPVNKWGDFTVAAEISPRHVAAAITQGNAS
jgi:6-phosphogluconolactonase (cycloisomerase 2 family)